MKLIKGDKCGQKGQKNIYFSNINTRYYNIELGPLLLTAYTEAADQFGGKYVLDNVTVIV